MFIENFTKKQKFIIYLMIIIAIILILLFLLKKDSSSFESMEALSKEEISLESSEKNKENVILVYVTGEIEKPSVVELNEGARIKDAIEKAGGLTDSAEIKNLNLAYKVQDGEKIYIPSLDDVIKSEEEGKEIIYITNKIEENKNSESGKEKEDDGLVNINKATQTELEMLPGIGPSMAKKIIDYRKENGNFNSIEDIKNVSGIGENKYDNIKDKISTN